MTLTSPPRLLFRLAGSARDAADLVALRDSVARWQISRGISQWRPGELDEAHFRERMRRGEVWVVADELLGRIVGAWELWWEDPFTWGAQPSCAGYIHRLMTHRSSAAPGTGRLLLAAAERRISDAGRPLARLDCAAGNRKLCRYYQDAGYLQVGTRPVSRPSGYPVSLFEKELGR